MTHNTRTIEPEYDSGQAAFDRWVEEAPETQAPEVLVDTNTSPAEMADEHAMVAIAVASADASYPEVAASPQSTNLKGVNHEQRRR